MAPCACGSGNKAGQTQKTYVHTDSSGVKKTYKSEVEAAAAVRRAGGTYRANG